MVDMVNILDKDRLFFTAINLQKLLGLNNAAADDLAQQNINYVKLNDQLFKLRLQQIISHGDSAQIPDAPEKVTLSGMPAIIQRLQAADLHNRCLLALFHVGPHRDLLPDLAAAGIPFSAPIAGNVYHEFYSRKHLTPEKFADCFELLAVDDPRIGRRLLKSIRNGRYPAIYVDGNMGPDGHHCSEGAETVNFGKVSIRVKAGIARLAAQFDLPILPLFCHTNPLGQSVSCGQLLGPPDKSKKACQHLMQQLYEQLFQKIKAAPEQWEYAACMQRWLIDSKSPEVLVASSLHTKQLRLTKDQVRLYRQKNKNFLVHVERSKAVVLPDILLPHMDQLATGFAAPQTLAARQQVQQLLDTGYLEQI